jgi:murein hydrolase activator
MAALIGGALAAGAVPAPGPVATTGPQRGGLVAERFTPGGLQEVRERLERQREVQPPTRSDARALALEIGALRRQHEQITQVLDSQRRDARRLERQLDYLVPRLLARQAEVRERRARTAQALADLAARSRGVRLDSTLRARMLAISPFMLEQLRGIESRLGSVGQLEQTIERHARIVRNLSGLITARQRVASRLAEKRWLHQAALERPRGLNADVRLPAAEQGRLIKRMPGAEAGMVTSAGPAGVEEAVLAGDAAAGAHAGRSGWGGGPHAAHRSASAVLAAAPAAALAAPAGLAGEAGWPATTMPRQAAAAVPRREAVRIPPGASYEAICAATSLEVAFEPPRRLPAIAATLRHPLPLLPVVAAAHDAVTAPDRWAMSIAAAPGQGVAAPVDGRIVFAGRFKSYGLLLIIEHEREYHTLLWGFAWLDVSPGDHVQAGQVVGIMGAKGDDPPMLHVERRRHGRPINLAATSSGIQG